MVNDDCFSTLRFFVQLLTNFNNTIFAKENVIDIETMGFLTLTKAMI